MKIGMLVDTYLPILGGAEIHVLELSRALRLQGFEITICTAVPSSPPHLTEERHTFGPQSPCLADLQAMAENGGEENFFNSAGGFAARRIEKIFPPILGEGGKGGMGEEFPVIRLPGLVGGGWRAVLGIPTALPQLIAFIRDVDFVHCHYSFLMAAMGTLLCRLLGKRSVVTLHGLGTLDSSVDKSPLQRLYRMMALKLAGTIIATSEEMRTVALRFAPAERVVVIPNGVNTRAFAPSPKPESTDTELVILTMRRLAPKNGVQYLVEAAPEVVAALPKARFWVAGEGKLESALRKRVKELGLEERFCFLGIVPHDRTSEYYHRANLVVFPSSAESTSLACLEAMCCEKAIVASSLSAYQEMLGITGERGILVSLFDREDSDYNAPITLAPERIHALAEAMIALAKDAEHRTRLGRAARRFAVERYDWNLIAAQTARIYQGEASMKIAIVAPTHLPSRRANTLQVMKMAQAFSCLGHSVQVAAPGKPPSPVHWNEIAHFYGLRIEFPVEWLPSWPVLRRYDYGLLAVRWARKWGARLLYTRLPQAGALASNLGMETMLEVHDVPKSRNGAWLFRGFLRGSGARRLVAITRALAADLSDKLGAPEGLPFTLIAPDGVDLERYSDLPSPQQARQALGMAAERFTCGYTGHLYAGRGIDLILEMAGRLPNVNILLAGGEPEEVQRLRERVTALGLENVILTGYVPNAELPLYQAACDLLLMPYQRHVAASSGGDIARYLSPMKLFEYMACGRPILCSDLPVLREVLSPENALLLSPDDVQAWVIAVKELLDDDARRASLGAHARQEANRYTWEARARSILEGYNHPADTLHSASTQFPISLNS